MAYVFAGLFLLSAPEASTETAVTTDDQFFAVEPSEVEEEPPGADGRRPLRVRGEFGRGVEFSTPSDSFAVQLRARAQLQARSRHGVEDDLGFFVRRMRLLFGGHAKNRRLSYYIQLGFSERDLETDRPVPLRDAFATAHLSKAFNLRIGQMKVPFDRQRVMSSSKLQLVERSDVVNELNLDRDAGIQVYGDLFGNYLRYHLGVFGGEGRNRFNPDFGLLYATRLRFFLTGAFDDGVESDLARERRLRVAVSAAAGFNHKTRRTRSTQGAFLGGDYDALHGAMDLVAKYAGLSFTAQALVRESRRLSDAARASLDALSLPASTRGAFAQVGYLTPYALEIVGRFGALDPYGESAEDQPRAIEATGGLSWYVIDHDLKVQGTYTLNRSGGADTHVARVQTQVFF